MLRRITSCLLVAAAAACGHSAKEVRTAQRAAYDAPFATVWNVVMTEVHKKHQVVVLEDPIRGEVVSAWLRIEYKDSEITDPTTAAQSSVGQTRGTTGLANTNQQQITPGMLFRTSVKVTGLAKGGPWRVSVDGEAADYKPGFAANEGIIPIKHGAADEPPWVRTRIENLTVAIHERLAQYAVKDAPVKKSDVAVKVMDDLPWSNLPDPGAIKVVDQVHEAASARNAPALRGVMADDFRWALGADGSAETAIALWSADTSKLKELAHALEEGCGVEDATGEVVCPAAGAAKSPSMARFRKVDGAWKFVLFLAR